MLWGPGLNKQEKVSWVRASISFCFVAVDAMRHCVWSLPGHNGLSPQNSNLKRTLPSVSRSIKCLVTALRTAMVTDAKSDQPKGSSTMANLPVKLSGRNMQTASETCPTGGHLG